MSQRAAPWLAFAAFALGCGGEDQLPAPDRIQLVDVPAVPSRQLDLLLQIDDSNSASEKAFLLEAALPALFATLATVDGGLPDLHVGVISSDLGGSSTAHPELASSTLVGCEGLGDDGLLQVPVTVTSLHGGAYVVDEAGAGGVRTTNYDGSLADVVRQLMRLGDQGCGFEQPLGAIRRALVPGHNAGFRRPEANLAVIILADEDDCSILDPALLEVSTDRFGALQSFRCTREGLVCDQPLDALGAKTNCRSNEDSAFVEPIALTHAALDAAAPSSAQVVLAAIVGDPTPVEVEPRTPPTGTAPIPALHHTCSYTVATGTEVADPAVRIAELVDSFESRGLRGSACAPPYTDQVRAIATAIKSSLGTVCLPRALPTLDCEAHDTHADGSRSDIPACDASRTTDCFELVDDPVACAETPLHQRFVVHRTAPTPTLTRVALTCAR